MSQTVRETATIGADPDTVWTTVGDVAAVSSWVPAIESSRLDGDIRTARFAGGAGTAREKIVRHDDRGRTYTYQYLDGPLPLARYESTITVEAAPGGGSQVVWEAQFAAGSPEVEAGLRDAIAGIYAQALAELVSQVAP